MKLVDVAKRAADAAALPAVPSSGPEVSRCVDAMKKLMACPVTTHVLAKTQLAKRVRQFTTHRQDKIKAMAFYLLESWKKIVSEEVKRNIKKNDGGNKSLRDKVRQVLVEALSKVAMENGQEIVDEINAYSPSRVAVLVESVMFKKLGPFNGGKTLKYRSIMFNIKDPKNPDLRRKVLVGEVDPERLIAMTHEEMASDKRQLEIHQKRLKKALAEERAEELQERLNSSTQESCFD